MPWLVVEETGQPPRSIEVSTSPFYIGRKVGNDLVLADHSVSREHDRVEQHGELWRLVDLAAVNGTYLNGARLEPNRPEQLEPGDEIRIGGTVIHFFAKRPGTSLIEAPPLPASEVTERVAGPEAAFSRAPDVVRAVDQVALPATAQYFRVLHDLAKHLLAARDLHDIGQAGLDLLFRTLRVERAAIALWDRGPGILAPLVERTRKSEAEIVISRTISEWVLRERVAIVTSDARHDPRFQRGESIHAHQVRSVICAPLWSETGTEGLIYLDNLFDAHAFGEGELELVTAVANQAAIGIRQVRLTEQVREAAIVRVNLSRYHSPPVVDMILRHSHEGRKLGLEVTEDVVTVLFADISGFTALAEQLTASEVAQLLNMFYERMTRVIFKFEGSVNKYIGDAVMATFGAPNRLVNQEELAVRAALAMQADVAEIRKELAPDRGFRVRIGVNTGRVVVGNVGSLERMEFTAVGDAVNVAQRLESICEPDKVYVGVDTYAKTRHLFQYRNLGELVLRGRQRQSRVYEVVP